jgi:predicted N-acyltransferase
MVGERGSVKRQADNQNKNGKASLKNKLDDYVIRVLTSPQELDGVEWNDLLAQQDPGRTLNPFMRHEYLAAMQASGSAVPATGWTPRFVALYDGPKLVAACALYLKAHSYGEYVFDWAWANAYQQHGLPYYPKAVVAPPFTPVPGPRLLARDAATRVLLVQALIAWCKSEHLSSLHLLFSSDEDIAACAESGLMLRHTVQFHWKNMAPTLVASRTALPPEGADLARGGPSLRSLAPTLVASRTALPPISVGPEPVEGLSDSPRRFKDFDDFLASLNQEKRKKIRQERRKVAEAGVVFRWSRGADISVADWDFFYRCYERTYLEHGNAPYLSRDFFARMAATMPDNWLLFVAERGGEPMACSLIGLNTGPAGTGQQTAYGRYWGALERVDCLHFEACYYQPLAWCIAHGFDSFEGGAQGEHKMARALLPVKTTSAHWLAHPSFADAVERFLEREGEGIANYMEDLERRNPFKQLG